MRKNWLISTESSGKKWGAGMGAGQWLMMDEGTPGVARCVREITGDGDSGDGGRAWPAAAPCTEGNGRAATCLSVTGCRESLHKSACACFSFSLCEIHLQVQGVSGCTGRRRRHTAGRVDIQDLRKRRQLSFCHAPGTLGPTAIPLSIITRCSLVFSKGAWRHQGAESLD